MYGAGVLLLVLTGSLGVACGIPLIAALCVGIPNSYRARRARGVVATFLVAAAFAIVAAYFWNFRREGVQSPYVSLAAWGRASLEYLTMGFGQGTKRFWPVSGLGVLALGGLAAGLLAHRVFRPEIAEGSRLAAVFGLLGLASPVAGAAAVGLGRQLQGGLVERYSLYAAPFACVAYAIFARYGPNRIGKFLQNALCLLACAGLFFGFSNGLALAKSKKEREKEFFQDIRAGLPMTAIVARHAATFGLNEESFRLGLETLREQRIGMFGKIADDPPIAEEALSPFVAKAVNVERRNGGWSCFGRESMLVFGLHERRHVYGIRFAYVLRSKRGSTEFRIYWSRPAPRDPFQMVGSTDVTVHFNSAKPRRLETQTIWINETIDGFAISPSAEPCEFQLKEVVFLVPR